MAAVSDMSPSEQRLHGHSANKERYVKANRWRRELTLQQAYALRDELDEAIPEKIEAIYEDWARDTGQDIRALKEEARWTGSVRLNDIRLAFAEELISDPEWQMRLGTSHVKQAAIAREQETGRRLTSEEKSQLLVECYHQNWTVAEFKAVLIERKLKQPPKAKLLPPTKLPTTIAAMLQCVAGALTEQEKDFGLAISQEAAGKPVKIAHALRKLAHLLDQHYPGAEFAPGEGKTNGVPDR